VKRGSQWTSGESIAAFLSFEAARRQKSTSTKAYRVDFAASCFPKFAAQLKKEGIFDVAIDIEKSRDVRFKYSKTGKNLGESAAFMKVADVKKEITNVILPLFEKQILGGVPPSGIRWERVMQNTKIAFFNLWKKGKKRYENIDKPNSKSFSLYYVVFEYLGPRGKNWASLKTGSLGDDDVDLDTTRESAKKGVRATKKMKFDANPNIRSRMSKRRPRVISRRNSSFTLGWQV